MSIYSKELRDERFYVLPSQALVFRFYERKTWSQQKTTICDVFEYGNDVCLCSFYYSNEF